MHYMNLMVACLLALHSYIPTVQSCGNQNASAEPFELGNDPPADPATLGYTLNHFGLLVNNITASMHFYGEILGMRHIFTYRASSAYEIVYMGYSHGGRNGTGYQTGEELYTEKTNTDGLLELQYLTDCDGTSTSFRPSTQSVNTFSHVGLVVPDVEKTQARMEALGGKILKHVGESLVQGSAAAQAFGFPPAFPEAAAAAALKGIEAIGFKDFLIVVDPDGNMVEIQNQVQ